MVRRDQADFCKEKGNLMRIQNRMQRLIAVLAAFVGMTAVTAPTTAFAEDDPTQLDRSLDEYWGSKRDVRTIQKRLFMKDTRWAFTVFGGVVPNDDFQIFFPVGGRVGYYFSEDIGAEISGAYAFRTETDLRSFLVDQIEGPGGTSAEIFLTQYMNWYTTANVLWSPFHGKLGAFSTKLFHFDFYLTLGAGVVGLTVDEPGAKPETSEYRIAGNAGVGVMMYVLDFMAVRVDYRHFFFEFAGGGGGLSYPAEISAGLTFFTPAPK